MNRTSLVAVSLKIGGRAFGQGILPGVDAHFLRTPQGRDYLIGRIGFFLMSRQQTD